MPPAPIRARLRALLIPAVALVATVGLFVGPTSTANAATDRTWNRLANCESGGAWHINTGNGYYGGLQFSLGTWRAYKGGHFARRPDIARRVAQVAVAQRLLKARGWGAWPHCSQRLGLGPQERRADWGVGRWRHAGGHHHNASAHRRDRHCGNRFGIQV